MPTGSLNKSFSMNGHSFSNSLVANQTYDSSVAVEVSLPAGKVVTSWVKTDANTAAANLPSGHGYTDGKFDVHWIDATVHKRRYGVDGTIVTNALSLDGGTGDDFPASATVGVVCTKQVAIVVSIDGDNVKIFGVHLRSTDTAAIGSVDLQDASNNSIEQFNLSEVDNAVTGTQHEYVTTAAVALLTGAVITQAKASNGSSTAAATLYIDVGVDSTP